jgi:hypothetical protein
MRIDESRRYHQPRDVHDLVSLGYGTSTSTRRQHPDAAADNPHIKQGQRSPAPIRDRPTPQQERETAHRSPAGSTPLRATSSSILSAARSTWNRTTSPSDTSNPNTGGIGRLLYWNGEEK